LNETDLDDDVFEIPADIGPAAPMPEIAAKAGATQYFPRKPIQYYIGNGYLKEAK